MFAAGGAVPAAFFVALAVATALAAGLPSAASAHGYKLGEITIGHVWAPAPEAGAAGVPVYGPILNRGNTVVRLVGASTPLAERARFRTEKNGEVRWLEAIEFAPGKPLALAAWREHIWLSALKRPLREGDTFELTLDFADAGSLAVTVVVEKTPGH